MRHHLKKQSGFSLIELLVVILLVALVASFVFSYIFAGKNDTASAERLLADISSRLTERRNDAKRLNSLEKPTSLETFTAPPLLIDFGDPETTKTLITDGIDRNGDHIDDYSGKTLTHLSGRADGPGSWLTSYEGEEFQIPSGWSIARNMRTVNLPPISDGAVLTTAVAFNAKGEALAFDVATGGWQTQPNPAVPNSCWVIYAYYPNKSSSIRQLQQTPAAAVAVAIYPSGLIESFRFADGSWQGFRGRNADSEKKRGSFR